MGWSSVGNSHWNKSLSNSYWPDPFCDYASTVMPENIADMLKWSEFIGLNNGTYSSAVERIASYFNTEIELDQDISEEEHDQILDYLNDQMKMKLTIKDFDRNHIIYGNVFCSVIVPIRRSLCCTNPKCNAEFTFKSVANNKSFNFRWSNYQFHAKCPMCNKEGVFERRDRTDSESQSITVKFWSPHEIDIVECPVTKRKAYWWRIPEQDRRIIREGHPHVLESIPWEVVEAVSRNQDLPFNEDEIYHALEEPLAGHRMGGWGFSRVISNFRQVWYVQTVHRQNEAIAMDFINPFRLLTPVRASGAADEALDPLNNLNLSNFSARLLELIDRRRYNPMEWYTFGHPVEYQVLGGEARNLAPFDLLDQGINQLLNNIGIPAELHRGNLQLQTAAPNLRFFESLWQHLIVHHNAFLQWVFDKVSRVRKWKQSSLKMARTTVIDDLNDQAIRLQLVQNQMVSQSTGLASVGLEFKKEQRKILEEQRFIQEEQAKLQKRMELSAMGEQMAQTPPPAQQGMPAPGQPMPQDPAAAQAQPAGPMGQAAMGNSVATPTNPNTPITPQDMMAKAQTIASQLKTMPSSQRRSEMMKLKQQDPYVWSAVKGVLQDIDQQAASQGKQMILQQQFGVA